MVLRKRLCVQGRKGGEAWQVSWTIVWPTTLMDNFWSWQTPWLHPRTHLQMPHDRAAPLQLVWSDDIGYVVSPVAYPLLGCRAASPVITRSFSLWYCFYSVLRHRRRRCWKTSRTRTRTDVPMHTLSGMAVPSTSSVTRRAPEKSRPSSAGSAAGAVVASATAARCHRPTPAAPARPADQYPASSWEPRTDRSLIGVP